ncbi:MAG: hypothetical protein PHT62_08600 [Desulfotomaculaceae bacterium]|nr:hypothetical protein [Desulfotomaculaceae bacterium]
MKSERQQTLAELISGIEAYFKELSYSNARMRTFRNGWELLNKFMLKHSIEFYEPLVGDAFIRNILDTGSYEGLSRREKDTIRCANVLTEYQTTGFIKFRSVSKSYNFEGQIGELIWVFLFTGSYKVYQKIHWAVTGCIFTDFQAILLQTRCFAYQIWTSSIS